MIDASKRAELIRHLGRISLRKAVHLVQARIGGEHEDVLDLLCEAVAKRDLPAEVKWCIDYFDNPNIEVIDTLKTFVRPVDVESWLSAFTVAKGIHEGERERQEGMSQRWTEGKVKALRLEHERLKMQGSKSPTKTLAGRHGISGSRIRKVLQKNKEPASAALTKKK